MLVYACVHVNIYTVHPSGLLTNTPNQQTEPLDSVAPLIHYKAPLIFSHLCLASGPGKIPTGGDTWTEPTLWAPGVQMQRRDCRSAKVSVLNVWKTHPEIHLFTENVMSTSGPCGRLRSAPEEAQICGFTRLLLWLSHSSSEKHKEVRMDAVGLAGGSKVKENETISHMENRLIQHWALIETANALQWWCNPGVGRQLHVVNYQIINADSWTGQPTNWSWEVVCVFLFKVNQMPQGLVEAQIGL